MPTEEPRGKWSVSDITLFGIAIRSACALGWDADAQDVPGVGSGGANR